MGNVNFDFNKDKKSEEVKDGEKKQFESAEIKELTDAEQTEAPADDAELTDNTSEGEENQGETDKDTNGEADGEKDTEKTVVTYIGNGVWRDSEGECWARTENRGAKILTTRSYDSAEYEKREDLKFMVKYGEMKVTLV